MIANLTTTSTINATPSFLTMDELRRTCPAAFATAPAQNVSANYHFVPTHAIVERLATLGFAPVSAKNPVRKEHGRTGQLVNSSVGPHLITFEPTIAERRPLVLGEGRVQVVLFNSHNRSRRLRLQGGFLRLVCTNGLVVGENDESLHLTHLDSHMLDVDAQIERVLAHAGTLPILIERMQKHELSKRQTLSFAKEAMALRFGDPKLWRVTPEQILAPRREADEGSDLWRTFNRVQENLTKGGLHNERTPMPTMPLTRPTQTFKFNSQLWSLAEAQLN